MTEGLTGFDEGTRGVDRAIELVFGSIIGSPVENERTLNFSVLAGVRPWIEIMPLQKVNEGYRRMQSGDVKFRMVLTIDQRQQEHA